MPTCSCCGAKRTNIRGCGSTHDCLKGICIERSSAESTPDTTPEKKVLHRRRVSKSRSRASDHSKENQRLRGRVQELQTTVSMLMDALQRQQKPLAERKVVQEDKKEDPLQHLLRQDLQELRKELQDLKLAPQAPQRVSPSPLGGVNDILMQHIADLTPHNVETYIVPGQLEGEDAQGSQDPQPGAWM
jgi:uncharacterized Zn finger protein (UPF0148 family)